MSRKSSLAKHQKANIKPIHKREIFELLLAEGLINSTWYLKISNMTLRPAGKQGLKTDLPSNIILNCRNLISADTRGQMLYTLYNTLDMCAHIHTYKYIFNSLFTNDSLISLQTVWIHFHLLPESLSLLPVDEKTSEDILQCQCCSLRGWLTMRCGCFVYRYNNFQFKWGPISRPGRNIAPWHFYLLCNSWFWAHS